MDGNSSESALPDTTFDSSGRFPDDDLLDGDLNQGVTWLNDEENDHLDMSINIDPSNLFFNRVNSAEIIYQAKKKTCKMIGKYVMGDILGEGDLLIGHNDRSLAHFVQLICLRSLRFVRQSEGSPRFRDARTTCGQSTPIETEF